MTLEPQPKLQLNRAIRFTIPATVAADMGQLKEGIQAIADLLGCKACVSGFDCTFNLEHRDLDPRHTSQFLMDENFRINALQGLGDSAGDGVFVRRGIAITAPPEVTGDIHATFDILDRVGDMIGCKNCFSGHDCWLGQELGNLSFPR